MVHKNIKKLSQTEAAYLAGLIDGEGTITLTHRQKGAQRQLVVSISNTERDLLLAVLKMLGVGKITSKKESNSLHRAGYAYVLSNRQALALLDQIISYLHSYKKHRAQLIIDSYMRLTPRNGKYSKVIFEEREEFIKKFFDIKFSLQNQGEYIK